MQERFQYTKAYPDAYKAMMALKPGGREDRSRFAAHRLSRLSRVANKRLRVLPGHAFQRPTRSRGN